MKNEPEAASGPTDDDLVDRILAAEEGQALETKRVGKADRKLETIVAFANTDGGILVLGIEDARKAEGRQRVHGIQENPESVDELRRLIGHRITPRLAAPDSLEPSFTEVPCSLWDGSRGSIVVVRVARSTAVHSIVDDGTFIRLGRSNRQIQASEITELALRRGAVSAVNGTCDVPFTLLETDVWREYAAERRLSRPIAESLVRLGLARSEGGTGIRPTRAAVLLFAEEPGGLLDAKCAIRLFHYKGERIEHSAETNLLRKPRTISGPLVRMIPEATRAIVDELASGLQMGPLGFEIAQRYPVRVLREAVTNAVLHRDYRLPADIHVRIFSNRIEVESPGLFPVPVTLENLREVGSRPRNKALVTHLREFPSPPNLDAGEGVRMMFETMERASLYPPVYVTEPELRREAVLVTLLNGARPSIWDQVHAYLQDHPAIGNAEVRRLLGTDNAMRASRLLRSWVEDGLLVPVDPGAPKRLKRYRLREKAAQQPLLSFEV